MINHVFDHLLSRLSAVYGEPKSDNPDLFAAEYARVLSQYEPEELSRAADFIIESHKYAGWPKINDCVNACEDARRKIGFAKSGQLPKAGIPGTGWRLSDSSRQWFQIERGSKEFAAWMKFYRSHSRHDFAAFLEECGRTWVLGPSPAEHGGSMLAYLDSNRPKSMLGDEA